jgi:hypothetical protein
MSGFRIPWAQPYLDDPHVAADPGTLRIDPPDIERRIAAALDTRVGTQPPFG